MEDWSCEQAENLLGLVDYEIEELGDLIRLSEQLQVGPYFYKYFSIFGMCDYVEDGLRYLLVDAFEGLHYIFQ